MKPRRYGSDYRVPGKDSQRAIAQATQLLVGARLIEGFTAEWLAHQKSLSLKTAEYLLAREKARRADG